MKKNFLVFIIFFATPFFMNGQQTAGDFFETISEKYSKIEAYTASFKFTTGLRSNIVQEGVISFKNPNFLRMDYTKPADQVLNVNLSKLSIYVPAHDTLFEQTINTEEDASVLATTGITSQGLSLFNSNYTISYVNGP